MINVTVFFMEKKKMKSFTATEAKQNMGQLFEDAIREPVLVVKGKNRRPTVVVMSHFDYENLVKQAKK